MKINELFEKKCAVICIDLQNDYVSPGGVMEKTGLGITNLQKTLPLIKDFLDRMRYKKVPIIHFQMTEGVETLAENIKEKRYEIFGNPGFWELAVPGTWGHQLVFNPKDDFVLEKNTYDVFSNPKLKEFLDQLKIEVLIIIGGYTHVCVDTSIRSAVTKGYRVILPIDLINSPDKLQEVHYGVIKGLNTFFSYESHAEEIVKGIRPNEKT